MFRFISFCLPKKRKITVKTVQQNIIKAEKQPSVGHAELRKTSVLIQYFPCSKRAMQACKRSAKGLRGFKQDILSQTLTDRSHARSVPLLEFRGPCRSCSCANEILFADYMNAYISFSIFTNGLTISIFTTQNTATGTTVP